MTEKESKSISAGLDCMENAVDTLKGEERRQVCQLMQQLSDLTGYTVDLEACREEIRQEWIEEGRGWPAPDTESLARPLTQSAR
jgi:hypothetical protein